MRGAATMKTADAAAEARETVYVAIELSKKTWVLGIAHPDRDRPSIHRVSGGNIGELVSRLRVAARNNPRIPVCFEAWADGSWLARALVARVVHSAGYNLLSFTRAFAVLNCQSALVCFLLRSASHASTSCFSTR